MPTEKVPHLASSRDQQDIQGCDPVTASPIAIIAATKGTLLVFLNWLLIKLGKGSDISFWFSAIGLAVDSEATTSSHIEEMIQELAQQEGLEAPVTGMPQESATIEVREASHMTYPGIRHLQFLNLVREYWRIEYSPFYYHYWRFSGL